MENSKLVQVLKTLTKKEFKEFESLAGSPFFNTEKSSLLLLKQLKKFYPDFTSKNLTKENLFSKIYPGKEYNDQVLKNAISILMRMCGEYFFQINARKEKLLFLLHSSDEFLYRRLFKDSGKAIENAFTELNSRGIDQYYFYWLYKIEDLNCQYYMKYNDEKNTISSSSRRAINLMHFFLTEMSSQIDDLHAYKHSFNAPFETHPLYKLAKNMKIDFLTGYDDKVNDDLSEITEIYTCLIKLTINNKDEESFSKARALFKNNFTRFSLWGKLDIFASLIGACIKLEILNKQKYAGESFRIHKEMIENNIYNDPEKSPMNLHMFRRCILLAETHKDFEWMEKFIRENTWKLPPEYRENMENFSRAILNFCNREFEKSLTYAGKITFEMFAFKYDLKALLLKIYYELGHNEQALSMIDSFRHFLSDNKSLSEIKKEEHRNFIRFAANLANMKTTGDYSRANLTLKEISETNSVSAKQWLIEKASELTGSDKKGR